jgi:ArsR family transcriptional regulator, virulence genes transcriptional regulator
MQTTTFSGLEAKASEAADFLKLLANEQRLHILCQLIENGEMSVMRLAERVHLGQSALSQHLARLREDGLVAARREAQTMHYSVADPRAIQLLKALKRAFCP